MAQVRIMLDAGHGGIDSGAVLGKRHEADDVLKVVLRVGKLLEHNYKNVVVGYTRKTDIYEPVTKKAADSNAFNADYFFSFHRNSFEGKSYGFETEYYSHTPFKDAVMRDIGKEMAELGFTRRSDKVRKNLCVLRCTNAPSLLFEIGFIDNPKDNRIFDKQFDKIVDAFVRVIAKNCKLVKITVPDSSIVNPPKQVKRTSPASDIRWLQRRLNKLSVGTIPDLVVDGKWGKKTTKKLRGYWRQLGWRTTGTYAGKKTCQALAEGRKR